MNHCFSVISLNQFCEILNYLSIFYRKDFYHCGEGEQTARWKYNDKNMLKNKHVHKTRVKIEHEFEKNDS